jgi:hypothetical protein
VDCISQRAFIFHLPYRCKGHRNLGVVDVSRIGAAIGGIWRGLLDVRSEGEGRAIAAGRVNLHGDGAVVVVVVKPDAGVLEHRYVTAGDAHIERSF